MPQTPRPPMPIWVKFNLELTTPAFLGGAKPRLVDEDVPLRVASVRGALRHWLRLGLGERLGGGRGSAQERRDALQGMRRLEALLFGAVTKAPGLGPDDLGGSRVIFKTPRCPPPLGGEIEKIEKRDFPLQRDPLRYMSYGVFDGRDQAEVTRLRAGSSFEQEVGLRFRNLDTPDQRRALTGALAAVLYLWGQLGGLGARSRRGWGGVHLSLASAPEGPWAELFPASPPQSRGELIDTLNQGLDRAGKLLDQLAKAFNVAIPAQRVPLPELRTLAGLQKLRVLPIPFKTGEEAIRRAGQLMMDFRSTLRRTERGLRPLDDYSVVRTAIERGGPMQAVDRAAFGLPLPFYFRSLNGARGTVLPVPPLRIPRQIQRPDRLPSALLFRVARVASGYAMLLLYLDEGRPGLAGCTLRLTRGKDAREDSSGPGPSGRLVQAFMDEAIRRVKEEGR